MDAYENGISLAVGNSNPLVQSHEIVGGSGFNNTEPRSAKDRCNPPGSIKRQMFFTFSNHRARAGIVSTMAGIHHHGVEEPRRLQPATGDKTVGNRLTSGKKDGKSQKDRKKRPTLRFWIHLSMHFKNPFAP